MRRKRQLTGKAKSTRYNVPIASRSRVSGRSRPLSRAAQDDGLAPVTAESRGAPLKRSFACRTSGRSAGGDLVTRRALRGFLRAGAGAAEPERTGATEPGGGRRGRVAHQASRGRAARGAALASSRHERCTRFRCERASRVPPAATALRCSRVARARARPPPTDRSLTGQLSIRTICCYGAHRRAVPSEGRPGAATVRPPRLAPRVSRCSAHGRRARTITCRPMTTLSS